jgi:hypothetical protein
MVDGGNQHGMHYYWALPAGPELTDDVIEVLCGLTDAITSPLCSTAGFAMGAAGRVDPDATAVGERGNGFELNIVAGWPPPDPDGDCPVAWSAGARRCSGRTAAASTPTSSPTRARPGSRPPTATASSGSPPSRTAGTRPTCSV